MQSLIIAPFIVFIVFILIRIRLLMLPGKKMRILTYHKVTKNENKGIAITAKKLEEQIIYMLNSGYSFIRLSNMLDTNFQYPSKPVLLTFDDGYQDNWDNLYPLLIKHNIPAAVMLVADKIGKTSDWDGENAEPLMNEDTLAQISPQYVEFGLHSFDHKNFTRCSLEELETNLKNSLLRLTEKRIPFLPVLAYPFGKFPQKKKIQASFFNMLNKQHIKYGMRLGNDINSLPLKNPYQVKRIDINGCDTLSTFKAKLKRGRIKPF